LHDKVYKSFDKNHKFELEGKTYDVLNVDLNTAVEMLKLAKRRSAPTPLKELGPHPEDGEMIAIFEGRYGAYVKHGKINATIPKDHDIESVRLEEACDWLTAKAAKKGGGRKPAKKKAPKKKAAKKAIKKKAAKKKPAKKKAADKKTSEPDA